MTDKESKRERTVFLSNENYKLDYTAVRSFAPNLVTVFPAGRVNVSPSASVLRARHVLERMQADDYLLLAGDPVAISICAVVAAEKFGRVKFLRWQRPPPKSPAAPRTNLGGYYEEVEVNFKASEDDVDVVRVEAVPTR